VVEQNNFANKGLYVLFVINDTAPWFGWFGVIFAAALCGGLGLVQRGLPRWLGAVSALAAPTPVAIMGRVGRRGTRRSRRAGVARGDLGRAFPPPTRALGCRVMRSRTAVWVNLVFATVVVVGVFLQVYLITSYFTGAGEGALDAHGFVGGVVVHASELIVFLSALVAFWRNWRWIVFNLFLLVLGTVQIFLSPPDEDRASGWIHGLHGLLALFVLVTAAIIAHRDMRLLGLKRSPAREAAISESP